MSFYGTTCEMADKYALELMHKFVREADEVGLSRVDTVDCLRNALAAIETKNQEATDFVSWWDTEATKNETQDRVFHPERYEDPHTLLQVEEPF